MNRQDLKTVSKESVKKKEIPKLKELWLLSLYLSLSFGYGTETEL